MANEMFKGMFGKIADGMCRLSMNGDIAIKTSNGYKTYNLKQNRLTNCSNFVFDIGQEFFFVMPTNKVHPGDIILVSGQPKCVVKNNTDSITVVNYEDGTIENILPERHVFMGNTYFYGRIVSMFSNNFGKGNSGMKKMLSYMMMSELLKGDKGSNDNSAVKIMAVMSMLNGGMSDNMFGDMFDFDDNEFDIAEGDAEEEDV